jgi:excinuclease ABC subunit C
MLTKTEVEAFLLEASLIKKHRPRYNIRLKDDKAYPYIRISVSDDFPRFYLARKVKKDGSVYFGPYTSGLAVRETIRFLNATFKIRDCKDSFMKSRKRPCITYEIGRCTAPCVAIVTKAEYGEDLKDALAFLKGRDKKVVKDLEKKMKQASEEERFEQAAKLRDSVSAVKSILEKQAVVNATSDHDIDVFSFVGDARGCLVYSLHIRQGRVIGQRDHFLKINIESPGEDVREWFVSFLNQYYDDNFIPDEVITPVDLGNDLNKLLGAVLNERSGHKVGVQYPSGQEGHRLLEMAATNAKNQFENRISKQENQLRGLEEIQSKFHLPALPQRIECYDISNIQGTSSVASQVVFEDGVPNTDQYRRYKIKTVEGANDFASMKEVLLRRFKHTEWEDPQLILVDGGKGQLKMAVEALKELGRSDVPVASIAKARTESDFEKEEVTATQERFFLPGRQNPVLFLPNSEAHHILVNIRDEAHRFAITYHRKLRDELSFESVLDHIVGLGEKRKTDLLKAFPSVDAIREASLDDLAKVSGINRALAGRILAHLSETNQDAPVEAEPEE